MNGAIYDSEATLGPSDVSASDTDTESCMSSRSTDKNKKRKQKRKAAKAARAAASSEATSSGLPVRRCDARPRGPNQPQPQALDALRAEAALLN